jgi:hypothetical protein
MNRQQRRAKAKTEQRFDGFPYENYIIGITKAARELMERGFDRGDFSGLPDDVTSTDIIRAIAHDKFHKNGMPPTMTAQFRFQISDTPLLTVQIEQGEQTLACWVSEESKDGKIPVVIVDPEDCPYCNGTLPPPEGHSPTIH